MQSRAQDYTESITWYQQEGGIFYKQHTENPCLPQMAIRERNFLIEK
jgi:hypothetical protein